LPPQAQYRQISQMKDIRRRNSASQMIAWIESQETDQKAAHLGRDQNGSNGHPIAIETNTSPRDSR
jgi:hypothetical protein